MLIGIDASRANRDYKTGTEWYSYYLIKNLAEIDSHNRYFLYTDKPLQGGLLDIVRNHPNFEEKLLRWPVNSFWTLGRLSLEMLKFWSRPRVLFVPAHSIPLFHPRRTLTTIHDIAFLREQTVYERPNIPSQGRIFRRILATILRHYFLLTKGRFEYRPTDYLNWSTTYALKHARQIITVSESTKADILQNYQVRGEKISVVYNGYNNELYKKINDPEKIREVLKSYGIFSDYLLYVGRLEKKKNIPMLIEAFAILLESHPELNIKLLLVGHAGYGYDEIKYIIEEYNLDNKVLMLGWIEEADLPYLYNGARAFVFPSRHEGFGIPIIQSLACGLPTAVSDIPVLREVAQEAVVFFNKDDKQDIAQKIYLILTDEAERTKLIARGYQRSEQFSWQKCAAETLKIITAL